MVNYQTPLRAWTSKGEGLEQRGRNDPSHVFSEELPKKKERFELTETSADCSWDLDPILTEYANKYMDNFLSN